MLYCIVFYNNVFRFMLLLEINYYCYFAIRKHFHSSGNGIADRKPHTLVGYLDVEFCHYNEDGCVVLAKEEVLIN